MKHYFYILLLTFLVFSCNSSKRVTTRKSSSKPRISKVETKTQPTIESTKPIDESPNANTEVKKPSSAENYITSYASIAQEEMKLYGIPASITLAQGILESSSGNGRLAIEANNHFGIKCHDWNGDKIYHDDDREQECFRKYKDARYSFRDHSLFLKQRSRYSNLFTLRIDDYKGWAKGLKAAGYATDKKYPDKLISLIERYDLHKFDNVSLDETVYMVNETHTVEKGDTLYSISKKYNLTVKELQEMNGLKDTNISIGQVLRVKS